MVALRKAENAIWSVIRRLSSRRDRNLRGLRNFGRPRNSQSNFYGQYGQDKFCRRLLGQSNGLFIDVGAYDGITNSNTLFFERHLGWKGLLVEPNPSVFSKLAEHRSAVSENVAIGASPGSQIFSTVSGYAEQLSALDMHTGVLSGWRRRREIKRHGGEINAIPVQVVPLQELIEKHSLHQVQLLSVDVEGAEEAVIRSVDFSRFHAQLVLLENNYGEAGASNILISRGYTPICRVGSDVLFLGPYV